MSLRPKSTKPARTADGFPACEFCGGEMTQRSGGAELVSGWAPQRSQGGANQVSVVHRHDRFCCDRCWPLVRRGVQPATTDRPHQQETMFDV